MPKLIKRLRNATYMDSDWPWVSGLLSKKGKMTKKQTRRFVQELGMYPKLRIEGNMKRSK